MIKLKHTVLASPEQMEFIIEGMRNPTNSWENSDSKVCNYMSKGYCDACEKQDNCATCREETDFYLGGMDEELMQRLSNAGTDHRKFMRMMPVYVRITAPLYWWKEFDTYKVGTVANSCSTPHTIAEKEFTVEDFSTDQLCEIGSEDIALLGEEAPYYKHRFELDICSELNFARRLYLAADKKLKRADLTDSERKHVTAQRKKYWWQMIQLLPSSYNQTRNVMMNYEVLANIYKSRKDHKLDEWREFCKWIETLPYSELILSA
jgi:hypothetical protein